MKDYSEEIIGMSQAEAAELLDEQDVMWRVVSVDGVDRIITLELREGRHNLHVETVDEPTRVVVDCTVEGA